MKRSLENDCSLIMAYKLQSVSNKKGVDSNKHIYLKATVFAYGRIKSQWFSTFLKVTQISFFHRKNFRQKYFFEGNHAFNVKDLTIRADECMLQKLLDT